MVTDPLIRLLRNCEWDDGCLVWTGSSAGAKRSYGTFRIGSKVTDPKTYVHRYTYERFVGPIPAGMEIDHVKARGCHSSLCVLPWHLEAVKHGENMRRARKDVCSRGHDLTDPANQQFDKQGRRRGCKQCGRDRHRRK